MKTNYLAATLCALLTPIAQLATADVKSDVDVQAAIKLADAWAHNQLDYDGVPGASVAVVHDQEVVWAKGFGFARIKGKVKATADTKFSICSVSKLFTSIGVMQQRDAGNLSLDAPISEILPWYDLPAHSDAEEPVTLRNILSHVAGLPREAVTPYWTEVDFPSQKQIRKGLQEQQPYYQPYDRFQYSNLGLTLAGEAVAAASEQDYHSYIKANILEPLGMADTTSELPVKEYGKSFAAGYKLRDSKGKRKEVGKYTTNGIAPAAGFASSANDLAKFASWQFRLRESGGTEVLKSATLREMQRIHWALQGGKGPTWGLGFALYTDEGTSFAGHGGYCPGYRTSFLTNQEDKLAIIAMVNVNDYSPYSLAMGINALTAGAIKQAAAKNTQDTEGETGDFSRYEGTFGREDSPIVATFAATSKGLKSVDHYASKPANSARKYKHEEGDVFRVLGRDGKETHTIRFEMDKEGKATRVWQHGQYLDRMD